MSRGMKMIVMLVALVLLVGGYQLLLKSNEAQLTEKEGTFALSNKEADTLTALTWSSSEGDFSFERTEDGWGKADDAAFPVNQDELAYLSDSIASLVANRQIEGVEKLEDYGLDDPMFSVIATWGEESVTYSMGDATPFGDGYYVMLSGDDTVYTTTASLESIFSYSLTDLCQLEEMPEIETVTHLAFGSDLDIELLTDSKTINPGELWYATGSDTPMDTTSVDSLISEVQALDWQDIISASADGATITEYALDAAQGKALTVYNGEEILLELMLGATNEDGDYYARLMDSKMIYTISSDSLTSLLAASNESLRSMELIVLDEDNVAKLILEADDLYEIAVDSESFTEIYDQITAISGNSFVDSYDDAERILRIEIENSDGMTTEFSFYAYDVDSYACPQTDGSILLVSADGIDKLVRMLR